MSAVGNYEVVYNVETVNVGSGVQTVSVSAPSGKVVLGGGYQYTNAGGTVRVLASYPTSDGLEWRVDVLRNSQVSTDVMVWATVAEMGVC